MQEQFSRTALLLGADGVEKLAKSRVAVFGLGGVGSWCAEALARAGVGELTLIDKDRVEESNINRQLVALRSTVGRQKVQVMAERIRDIAPACRVTALELFYLPETAHLVPLAAFDYVADCIDNVTAKLRLICEACARNVPVLSAMGAGNRLDGSRFRVGDIAASAFISERECLRSFSRSLGISPLQFLLSYRLKEAERLLREEGMNISEIAYRTGFESPSHFSSLFRRRHGLTPTEYRRRVLS